MKRVIKLDKLFKLSSNLKIKRKRHLKKKEVAHFHIYNQVGYTDLLFKMRSLCLTINPLLYMVLKYTRIPLDSTLNNYRILTTIRENNQVELSYKYPLPDFHTDNPIFVTDWNLILIHNSIPKSVANHKPVHINRSGLTLTSFLFCSDATNIYDVITGKKYESDKNGYITMPFFDEFGNEEPIPVPKSKVLYNTPFTMDKLLLLDLPNYEKPFHTYYLDKYLNLFDPVSGMLMCHDGIYKVLNIDKELVPVTREYLGDYYNQYIDVELAKDYTPFKVYNKLEGRYVTYFPED